MIATSVLWRAECVHDLAGVRPAGGDLDIEGRHRPLDHPRRAISEVDRDAVDGHGLLYWWHARCVRRRGQLRDGAIVSVDGYSGQKLGTAGRPRSSVPGAVPSGQLVPCFTAQVPGTAIATLPKVSVFQPEGIFTVVVVGEAAVELSPATRVTEITFAGDVSAGSPAVATSVWYWPTGNGGGPCGEQVGSAGAGAPGGEHPRYVVRIENGTLVVPGGRCTLGEQPMATCAGITVRPCPVSPTSSHPAAAQASTRKAAVVVLVSEATPSIVVPARTRVWARAMCTFSGLRVAISLGVARRIECRT